MKKITVVEITAIKSQKIVAEKFKVRKIGAGVFSVHGFYYGDEVLKMKGTADEVAGFINQYLGLAV